MGERGVDQTLSQRFNQGVIWNLLAILFNQGSTFLTNIIVANLLGRRLFGEYVMVLSTVQSLASLASLGMGYTATRYLAEFRSCDKERAGRILGLCSSMSTFTGSIAATALFLLAPTIAVSYLHAPQLTPLLRLSTGFVLFAAMNGYLTGVLAGLEGYRVLGHAGIFAGLLYVTICAVSTWTWDLAGASAGLVVSAILQWLILRHHVRKVINIQNIVVCYRGLAKERAIIIRWVLPGVLSGLTSIPALWLAQTFLARQAGGYAELAIYSAAYNLMTIVLFLPNVANNVGMSLINNIRGMGNPLHYRHIFWVNLRFTTVVLIIGVFGMVLGGQFFLRAFGESFTVGFLVLLILLAATIPESLTYALNQILQSNEKIWLAVLAINIPRDTLIPTIAYFLAPLYGASGVAVAYFSGRIVALVATSVCVWRIGLIISARYIAKTPRVTESQL